MTTLADAPPLLTVESGPQSGAQVAIPGGLRTVGGDVGDDIVLFDPALSRSHFTLEPESGGVRLHAVGGLVALQDGTELPPGQSALCSAATLFRAGDTRFHLHPCRGGPDRPPVRSAPTRRVPLRAALTGAASVAFCAVLAGVAALLGATPAAEAVRTLNVASIPTATASSLPARPASAGDEALAATRARLAAVGIEAVQLTGGPDGSIQAQGQIPPGQRSAWQDLSRWFDTAYGGRAVLVDKVRVTAEAPPLAVRAVWPGPNPYVVDGNGEKLFVGAAVAGGWSIESIAADRVIVRRGGQAIAVRF